MKKQIEKLQGAQQGSEIEELFQKAEVLNGAKLISGVVQDTLDGMKKLREMADKIKAKDPTAVSILGVKESESGKPFMVVGVGSKVTGLNAGEVIKASADKFGGKGGGKPDFAQAGGTQAAALQDAINAAKSFVAQKLKNS